MCSLSKTDLFCGLCKKDLLEFLPAGHFIRVAQHDVRGSRNYDPKTKGVYVNLTDAATTLATPIKLTAAQTYKIAALMKPRKVSN